MRNKLGPSVTHLIAHRCSGKKVESASLKSVNVLTMKASWVENAWELRRLEPFMDACEAEFVVSRRISRYADGSPHL